MRVWLDDTRPMPEDFDVHVKTAQEAIDLLKTGDVTMISLDHDLGENAGTGYDVACFIEQGAVLGTLKKLIVISHTANPVGYKNIGLALGTAFRVWYG